MKKIIPIILSLIIVLGLAGCNQKGQSLGKNSKGVLEIKDKTGIHHAVINVEGYGKIEVELDGDSAPTTVTNFINLAEEGFYDGLTFHRIIDDFVIQAGDPKGDGTGGSENKIKGEFAENGVDNPISHVKGTLSMARLSDDMNSATSQFFILLENAPHLNGNYAAFGKVTKGMDIVEKIAEENNSSQFSGIVEKDKQPVIKSIKIKD